MISLFSSRARHITLVTVVAAGMALSAAGGWARPTAAVDNPDLRHQMTIPHHDRGPMANVDNPDLRRPRT